MEIPTEKVSLKFRSGALGRLWDILLLLLSVGVIFGVTFYLFGNPDGDIEKVLLYFDLTACMFFLTDIFWRWIAERQNGNFWKSYWLDLVSSIPFLYWMRYGRIVSIWRTIKNSKVSELISDAFVRTGFGLVLTISTIAFLLSVWICGILILHFEKAAPDALIKTPFDGIWFAFETVTTVGYGDIYPLTWQGRVVAIFLMVVGIGLFSLNSGLWASWILRRFHIEEIKKRLDDGDFSKSEKSGKNSSDKSDT